MNAASLIFLLLTILFGESLPAPAQNVSSPESGSCPPDTLDPLPGWQLNELESVAVNMLRYPWTSALLAGYASLYSKRIDSIDGFTRRTGKECVHMLFWHETVVNKSFNRGAVLLVQFEAGNVAPQWALIHVVQFTHAGTGYYDSERWSIDLSQRAFSDSIRPDGIERFAVQEYDRLPTINDLVEFVDNTSICTELLPNPELDVLMKVTGGIRRTTLRSMIHADEKEWEPVFEKWNRWTRVKNQNE